MVGELAVDPWVKRAACFLQPRDIEIQHQGQHRRAFGIMQPFIVGFVLRAARRRHHRPLTIAADDVVDDRAGLRDLDVAVDDDGRFAERMDFRKLRRRQPRLWIALIAHHLMGRAQFFQEPEDALRAGVVKVMQREHGALPPGCFTCPEA